MLSFECPSCKATLQTAEDFAGKSVICPNCARTATAPAVSGVTTPEVAQSAEQAKTGWQPKDGAYDEEPDDGEMRSIAKVDPRAWLHICVLGVIGLSVLVVLACLLIPPIQKVRVTSTRSMSTNNLKQIGLAFQTYHDMHKRLPFNGSDKSIDNRAYSAAARSGDFNSGSWAFKILPFIDQNPMFTAGGKGEVIPADDRVQTHGVACYMCPGRGRPWIEAGGGGWSDYFCNNYLNDPLQASKPDAPDVRRTLVGITDGTSNTIFVGHGNISTDQYALDKNVALCTNIYQGGTTGTMRAGDNGKASPTGVTLRRDSEAIPGVGSWGGPFPQGALMCMGDGSVRTFPYTTVNFGQFLTPTGGEAVQLPD